MKIQLDKDVLAEAVAWVARSLPARPSFPVLAGLMIRADADLVTLSTFDYETSAQVTVQAQVDQAGVVLVSGKLLADITRSLPNRPVLIDTQDNEVKLVCGSARFMLQTMPVHEYPELPAMPATSGWIDPEALAKSVAQVFVAAGRDELLPVFTGIRLEFDGDNLALMATDRYRIAVKEMTWHPAESLAGRAVLVPGKVLSEMAKSMVNAERITVALASADSGDNLIGFAAETDTGSRQITTRLLDGEFPKLRQLMNVPNDTTVRINTTELIAAVRRVALVAERNTSLRMRIESDAIVLDAARGDQATADDRVEALVNVAAGAAEVTDAGFNPHYLLDVLSVIDAPFVHFAFVGPVKPCLITGLATIDGDPAEDYRHVIMLMRLAS
ncbi:MAG: DNA polymerase III subunit beta [Propionibacteriaceae bacterium]|jgi:DNA polymerase-3 subunit beta|nr:DNA polymerase III subunit beta [Propionibacteriaceae bacterium]